MPASEPDHSPTRHIADHGWTSQSPGAPGIHPPVLVRSNAAEVLPEIGHQLLVDSDATGGALSCHRVDLARGQPGAVPHRHTNSSELFYVLDGNLEVLVGDQVHTAAVGDVVVVPRTVAHAFRARSRTPASLLIVIAPGVARFDYFRTVVQVRQGALDQDALDSQQDRFDTHFVTSPAWER